MAVLKNKTQDNFTMISNNALKDKDLRMMDRGVLCTICSFPDNWNFSIKGLAAICPDGKEALTASVKRLEEEGYLIRTMTRNEKGNFSTEIEVSTESKLKSDTECKDTRDGSAVTDNPPEYNTDNIRHTYNTDDIKSINQSKDNKKIDGWMEPIEVDMYRKLIADNISLDELLAHAKDSIDPDETRMVEEIYSFICDFVCYPRKGNIRIKGTYYPWATVKKQFLKLKYMHVADVLNRILDEKLNITRMDAYLLSSLYSASLVSTLEANSQIYDDYLKNNRGNPYK